jgi:hypothetical protein
MCVKDKDGKNCATASVQADVLSLDSTSAQKFNQTSIATTEGATKAFINPTVTGKTVSFVKYNADEYYLQGPLCAVCLTGTATYDEKTLVTPDDLEPNTNLQGNWLRWRALPGAGASQRRQLFRRRHLFRSSWQI